MAEPGLESVILLATILAAGGAVVGILHVFAFRLKEEKAFHDIKVAACTIRRQHDLRMEALRRARSGEEIMLDASDIVDDDEADTAVVTAREAPEAAPRRRAA